jgi:hypothetical protein
MLKGNAEMVVLKGNAKVLPRVLLDTAKTSAR